MENISELNQNEYRDFNDMQALVSAIARTMKVMSWGAHAWTRMSNKLLRFKVQARRHKGHIYIGVNGSDLFDVFLTSTHGRVIKEFKDVYLEDLVTTIDNEIERIPEYTR